MTEQKQPLKIQIDKKLINKEEIARRLDISGAYVHYLLTGKRKNEQLLKKIIEIVQNAA